MSLQPLPARPVTSKRLPHLPESSTSQAKPAAKIGKAGQTNPNEKGSPFLSAVLQSYDISHWIRRGPNVIVATVRSDHIPASLFANGLLVKEGPRLPDLRRRVAGNWEVIPTRTKQQMGNTQLKSERTGLRHGAICRRNSPGRKTIPVFSPFSDHGPSWESLLPQSLPCGSWPLRLYPGRKARRWLSSLGRDAVLHGPVIAGLLFMLLPNYDPRFPNGVVVSTNLCRGSVCGPDSDPFVAPFCGFLGFRQNSGPPSLTCETPQWEKGQARLKTSDFR